MSTTYDPTARKKVTHATIAAARRRVLAGLLVDGVALVPTAVLLHLDPLAIVHAALDRDVVPPLAFLARERHLHSLLALGHDLLARSLRFWVALAAAQDTCA